MTSARHQPVPLIVWILTAPFTALALGAGLQVGTPDPGATTLTVAVMVTGCPVTDGFTDDASNVDVEAGSTVCVRLGDIDAAKLRSPP